MKQRGRRVFLGLGVMAASLALVAFSVTSSVATNPHASVYRAQFHHTVPAGWMNDPQRPIYVNGSYTFYYLANPTYPAATPAGTNWTRSTTSDNVVFTDGAVSIPKTSTDGPWSGSAVVDTNNTAGFGAGAVLVLVTQTPSGSAQSQYLWYSTDNGVTFTKYGSVPVLANPGIADFRDPKVLWDSDTSRWIAVLAENDRLGIYSSPDMIHWTYQSQYIHSGIGTMECPDIYQIRGDDGTLKWVLGASANGKSAGLPNTYAYWVGAFNGSTFTAANSTPQWLDYGWDWYAGVTWPDQASTDLSTRFGMGWMNNWDYPDDTPTFASDGYNGTDSITRQIHLKKQTDNSYSLVSQPVNALANHASKVLSLGNVTVNNTLRDLDYHGTSYELDADVSWSALSNVGFQLRKSADGSRHIDTGVAGSYYYVNRGGTTHPTAGGHTESRSPFDPSATSVHVRILVDTTTVEVFVNDGKYVHSSEVFPLPSDDGLALYADGGAATFANLTITEFDNVKTESSPTSPFASFDGGTYGGWTTSGSAFGSSPATGTLPGQMPVTGFKGTGLVNSYLGGDASTGTLTSPTFTVNKPYLNFLVGGGNHPLPSTLYEGFEGSGWGSGWTATGNFSGGGSTAESLANQVGAKVLDTLYAPGGVNDSNTGTILSPPFTITRGFIDFLVAGGNHPLGASGETSVSLLVDGALTNTTTGDNSGTLRPVDWDVHAYLGHTAQIKVVDNATGAWGHLMVDQFLLADHVAATVGETYAPTVVNLLVGGQVVRTISGQDAEKLFWTSWDVSDFAGQNAQIQIVDGNTGGWGHINADEFGLSDARAN
jgi:sucrose-6-phosphate hydrolase SacC (GH32 family)